MIARISTRISSGPGRILAMASLLAGVAILPAPLAAAERGAPAPQAQPATISAPGVFLLTAQNDDETQGIMAQDDDQGATETGGIYGRDRNDQDHTGEDRWSRNGDQGRRDDRFGGQQERHDGWDQAQRGRGGWDHRDDRDAGRDSGWSPERRRTMAMHGRMMQMMQGRQQAGAAFRIEMGGTRMAVRCSPQETMRECVDATLSLVNRLRDASSGAKPTTGPDAGTGSSGGSSPAPSSPGGQGNSGTTSQ